MIVNRPRLSLKSSSCHLLMSTQRYSFVVERLFQFHPAYPKTWASRSSMCCSVSAPRSSNNRTIFMWSNDNATSSDVHVTLPCLNTALAFTSAARSSKILTIFSWPYLHATCNAVPSFSCCAFVFAPESKSTCTTLS